MVRIVCNNNNYEYDIRALVMAFYPFDNPEYYIQDVVEFADASFANEDTIIMITMKPECIYAKVNDKGAIFESVCDFVENDGTGRTYRDVLKRLLYDLMTKVVGEELPYGTLTGVRPSKLPMRHILMGGTKETAVEYMKNEYFCSDSKAELVSEVADREIKILEKEGFGEGYSVYIGIPFCPTVCTYCSFSSIGLNKIKKPEELMENYVGALEKEIAYVGTMFPDRHLTSIYVGGGTPTALSPFYMKRLMDIIKTHLKVDEVSEFCVEAGRPDSINEEMLTVLKEAGVDRISVNPQTMKQETLVSIGRAHTADQTVAAYKLARECGFNNINMDLIAGLYGENESDFGDTLSKIKELDPESFTVHSLVVKRASEYRKQKEAFEEEYSNEDVTGNMLKMAEQFAKDNGYHPYYMYRQKNKAGLGDGHVLENVGYAKEGFESVYNIMIMEEKQTIVACGAGAQTKIVAPYDPYSGEMGGITRAANVKNVYEYIDRIDEMIERKMRCISE